MKMDLTAAGTDRTIMTESRESQPARAGSRGFMLLWEVRDMDAEKEPGLEGAEIPEASSEESEAAQINRLLDDGYSGKQLVEKFDFKYSTVRREIKRRERPEDAPVVEVRELPATLKSTEVITPEGIMQRYLLEDGEYGEAMIKGMMLLRAAQRMVMDDVEIMKGQAEANARMIKPILDMMQEARKEQDAAADRARASVAEAAQEAAERTAGAVFGYLDQKLPKQPPPKDMSEMFAKRIDRMWEMMEHMQTQRMMPGYTEGGVPEGWEVQKGEGQ